MPKVKISVKNLYKVFGKKPKKALKYVKEGMEKDEVLRETGHTVGINNASFDVYEGETLVLMGLSGSGKSTVLRCLNKLIEPTDGKVTIDDESVLDASKSELREIRRKKYGMVFQNFALLPHKTVQENAEFGLEIQGIDEAKRAKKAADALKLVGLGGYETSYPDELSGGMQQRVGLARALANDPDVLLMDEAFSALDPLIRSDMQDELLELNEDMHKTIVFITHDLDEALKMGDRIVLMKDGKVVQIGTPEQILTEPATEYVEKFVEAVDVTKVLTAQDVMIRKPKTAFLDDGPVTALHKIRELGEPGIFVVNKKRKLLGYVTAKEAKKAADSNKYSLDTVMTTCGPEGCDVPAVYLDDPLREIFNKVNDANQPVAVIDKNNKFHGLILESSVIAGMVEGRGQ
ncbi:MAG: quaternary amine ABC transporter ATP-binding protein [Fusobacteriota bacterium]